MKKCDKYLSCGVHKCKNFCYECKDDGCQPCNVKVEKVLDCGHVLKGVCN